MERSQWHQTQAKNEKLWAVCMWQNLHELSPLEDPPSEDEMAHGSGISMTQWCPSWWDAGGQAWSHPIVPGTTRWSKLLPLTSSQPNGPHLMWFHKDVKQILEAVAKEEVYSKLQAMMTVSVSIAVERFRKRRRKALAVRIHNIRQVMMCPIRKKTRVLCRAEWHEKCCWERAFCITNPFQFTKVLPRLRCSGKQHLKNTYHDLEREQEFSLLEDNPPTPPAPPAPRKNCRSTVSNSCSICGRRRSQNSGGCLKGCGSWWRKTPPTSSSVWGYLQEQSHQAGTRCSSASSQGVLLLWHCSPQPWTCSRSLLQWRAEGQEPILPNCNHPSGCSWMTSQSPQNQSQAVGGFWRSMKSWCDGLRGATK